MIRYFGDFVIDSLKKRRLKVTSVNELNDPFDSALTYDDDTSDLPEQLNHESPMPLLAQYHQMYQRAYYKNENADFTSVFGIRSRGYMLKKTLEHVVKSELSSLIKLLCFSSSEISENADILMWSHYGNSHSGYRLHFEKDTLKAIGGIHGVTYSGKRPIMPLALFENEKVADNMLVKSKQWEYEDENRMFIGKDKTIIDPISKLTFINFPTNALLRVDIGMNPNSDVADELINILCEEAYQHVELYQTCLDDSMFRLNYERVHLSHQKEP
ncbi:MAG: DUF2971 domain-containing protein [Opitutaceae bacterium]